MVRPVDQSPFRAAFVVSAKSASLATDRNRIKRLFRESLRRRLDELSPNYHVVLLATRQAHGDLKRQDIDHDLDPLLNKSGVIESGGIDGDETTAPSKEPKASASFPRRIIEGLINVYQDWISPLLGRHCRFRPTCSEYTKEALRKHGVIKGLYFGVTRIIRCNPFSSGGYDPVP